MERPMKRRMWRWWGALALCACMLGTSGQDVASKTRASGAKTPHKHVWAMGMRHPALSPNGQHIAFGYQGDIWRVASRGGTAQRLTVHPAYDSQPRWSPDGTKLLFTSKRSGSEDVYVMSASGGYPTRLTHHSAKDSGLDWSHDGKWILIESNRENIRSLYKLSTSGGFPQRLVPGYWNLAHGGRLGPKSQYILFSEGMESMAYWWRKGYRGPNHGRIHRMHIRTKKSQPLSKGPHSELWPMWGPQGKSFYYVGDSTGTHNLWRSSIDGKQRTQITTFQRGPVRWPAINKRGTHIVFERQFGIWLATLNAKGTTKVARVPILIQSDAPRTRETWLTAKRITEFALSPDGKKLAFVMQGEVFVTDANGRTTIRRLTKTPWRERQIFWDKDSLHVHYTSERGQGFLLLRRSALRGARETTLLKSKQSILYPRQSPDGKHIAYLKGKNDWMLLSKKKAKPTLLLTGQIGGLLGEPPQWSPDSKWLMYIAYAHARGSLWAKHINPKKPPIQLTQTAAHSGDGAWTPDGKFVLYSSNRYGSDWFHKVGDNDLYALALKPLKTIFREDKLDKLFKKKKKKTKKKKAKKTTKGTKAKPSKKAAQGTAPPSQRPAVPTKPTTSKKTKKKKTKKKKAKKKKKKGKKVAIEANTLRHRARRATSMKGNEGWPVPGPKGKQIVFYSNSMGRYQLYLAKLKRGRILGARAIARGLRFRSAWSSHYLQWHPKGKAFYVLQGGKIAKVSVPKGRVKRLRLHYRMKYNRQARFLQHFREIWLVLRDHFYDPKMNGQDWGKLYQQFLPAVTRVQTKEDWRDLVNEMLGYLNASHLGAYYKRDKPGYRTGALGVDLRADGTHLLIANIYPRGPIHKAMPTLKGGQARLAAIDGVSVSAQQNPYRLLRNKAGKRVELTLSLPPTSKKASKRITKKIKIKPTGYWQGRRMRYRAWVAARKAMVKRLSKGRIGYLHMPNMTRRSLYGFIKDFETDVANKAASIVDLRFNFGGNVHDTVLQYLSRRRYATWRIRGLRSWSEPSHAVHPAPMAMLINEGSLSDAEMTANGFKALKLGTLIGEPTYRWLIFTYSGSLMGGGGYRIPEWGCYTKAGKDLEKIGVAPHIRIRNTLADRIHGRDPQLKRAIAEMQKKINKKR